MTSPLVVLRNASNVPILAWAPDGLRAKIISQGAAAVGFDVVVLTANGIQDAAHHLEAAGVTTVVRGCAYLDNGIPRDVALAKRKVTECAPQIAQLVLDGHRVLVLCAAGENRSAVMTARIAWLLTGRAGAEIVAAMRAVPREAGVTFSNGVFRRWAESWPAHEALRPVGGGGSAASTVGKIALGVAAGAGAIALIVKAIRG